MRSLILFFRGIKASIKQNSVIYCVFVFFYIFSTILTIYVIGKYSGDLWYYDEYEGSLTTFNIYCGKPVSEVYEVIQKYTDDENVEFIEVWIPGTFPQSNSGYFTIAYAVGEFEMTKKYFKSMGLKKLDVNDFINSNDSMIMVEDALTAGKDFVEVQGASYNVIESVTQRKFAWGHLVSYKSVLENDFYIRDIDIKFKTIPSAGQYEKIKKALIEDFPDAQWLEEPVMRSYNLESILSFGNILIYLVIALSAVNFIYIFQYIIQKRVRSYEIFSLCGCSTAKMFIFAAAEILLTSVVLSLAGCVLFEFAARPIIIMVEPLLTYIFSYKLYIAVFGGSALLSFVVLTVESIFLNKRRRQK